MIAVTRRLLLAAALLLAACNTGFAPQSHVTDVRILAVRDFVPGSTTADVAPGSAVVLEALVANPQHRPGLTVGWFTCLPPANQALTPCDDRLFLVDPSRLLTTPGVIPLGVNVFDPLGAGSLDPSVVASIAPPITDPATVTSLELALGFALDTAVSNPAFVCSLFTELPVIVVAEAGGVQSLARKQVRLASLADIAARPSLPQGLYGVNTNPAVADVLRGSPDPDSCTTGASLSAPPLPAGRTTICGTALDSGPLGGPQAFGVCDPTPRLVGESQSWQWYATDGEFPDSSGGVGNATGQNLDFTRPAGPFSLWAIVRDGRGGTGWARYDLGAAP